MDIWGKKKNYYMISLPFTVTNHPLKKSINTKRLCWRCSSPWQYKTREAVLEMSCMSSDVGSVIPASSDQIWILCY